MGSSLTCIILILFFFLRSFFFFFFVYAKNWQPNLSCSARNLIVPVIDLAGWLVVLRVIVL